MSDTAIRKAYCERYTTSSEAMLKLTAIGGMLRRLAPNQHSPPFQYRPTLAA